MPPYHSVIADRSTPQPTDRSLAGSLFAVPHQQRPRIGSAWTTHVLRSMVLTKFDIDGPEYRYKIGQVGRGHGNLAGAWRSPPNTIAPIWKVKMVDDYAAGRH